MKEDDKESSNSSSPEDEEGKKVDSDIEDAIDDLYLHMNEEKDSDLGLQDLAKLKKRLFDTEFKITSERYNVMHQRAYDSFVEKFEEFKGNVNHTLQERESFVDNF